MAKASFFIIQYKAGAPVCLASALIQRCQYTTNHRFFIPFPAGPFCYFLIRNAYLSRLMNSASGATLMSPAPREEEDVYRNPVRTVTAVRKSRTAVDFVGRSPRTR